MNYHDDIAGVPWHFYSNDDAAAATAAGNNFPGLSGGDYSTDGGRGGGGGGRRGSSGTWEQPALSCLGLSPPPVALPAPGPPSEDEMALWLYEIFRGDDEGHARDDHGDVQRTPAEEEMKDLSMVMCTVPAGNGDKPTEGMGTKGMENDSSERLMKTARRSHHGRAHNQTEKKRRCKISERLKTLQQLVPGCDKSNHASTLEQTITYMKSLQHQVQAISVGPPVPSPAAVYPVRVVPPPYRPPATVAPVDLGPPPMVAFRPVLHYRAAVMLMPATAHPPAAHPPGVAAPAAGGRRQGWSRNKGKGGRNRV